MTRDDIHALAQDISARLPPGYSFGLVVNDGQTKGWSITVGDRSKIYRMLISAVDALTRDKRKNKW
jgi:hypothetical protein